MKKLEIASLQHQVSTLKDLHLEENKKHDFYEENLDFLKKTIEQQRAELNQMKERVSVADLALREA